MLILICGDTHITGKNPVGRTDDILEAQFYKWEEIISIANEYDVPIIHVGDVFNVSLIANSILTKIGFILEELWNPMYFVWGNHDLLYHSLDLWNRTSLGVLWKHNDKVKHISEFYEDYKIWWAWNDWGSEKGIQWYGRNSPEILLTHKAVVSERKMGKGSWVVKDENFCMNIDSDPELRKYRLIICGHWHKPYIFKYKGTTIINPGPILRRSVEEWLMPSVVLLNTDTLLYKKIYLKSAKPPDKVLSKTHIEQRVESYTEGVIKFVEQLKHVSKPDKKRSFMKNLFKLLDSHELPKNIEKMLRNMIADLIEKGELKGI
jgi:predicted phosphodiesterase